MRINISIPELIFFSFGAFIIVYFINTIIEFIKYKKSNKRDEISVDEKDFNILISIVNNVLRIRKRENIYRTITVITSIFLESGVKKENYNIVLDELKKDVLEAISKANKLKK